MNCQTCGAAIPNGAAHCPNCGAPALTQQPQYQQQQYQQPYQQPYGAQQQGVNANVDMSDLNIVLKIVSLIFPLIGIILYFVWKNSAPNKAKSAITFAGIGILVNLILYFL